MTALCAPWSQAGPRKSLDIIGVLLFVGALLSGRPVLANRLVLGVIGAVLCAGLLENNNLASTRCEIVWKSS